MTRKNFSKAVKQPTDRACCLVSLYWDYENVRDFQLAQDLVSFCQLRGQLQVQKVYTNRWNHSSNASRTLQRLGFSLINVFLNFKNSADYRCMFDCIETAQGSASPDLFVIISGDADYAPVIRLLKQWEKRVIVFARRGSDSELLKKLAHEFYFVDELTRLVLRGNNGA